MTIPEPTVLTGVMSRGWAPGVIADLTTVPHKRSFDKPTMTTTLAFAAHLEPEVADAVWERMTSVDDVDQARRAVLRAAVVPADYATRCLAAYVLGEQLPDLPEETP